MRREELEPPAVRMNPQRTIVLGTEPPRIKKLPSSYFACIRTQGIEPYTQPGAVIPRGVPSPSKQSENHVHGLKMEETRGS